MPCEETALSSLLSADGLRRIEGVVSQTYKHVTLRSADGQRLGRRRPARVTLGSCHQLPGRTWWSQLRARECQANTRDQGEEKGRVVSPLPFYSLGCSFSLSPFAKQQMTKVMFSSKGCSTPVFALLGCVYQQV